MFSGASKITRVLQNPAFPEWNDIFLLCKDCLYFK